MNELKYESFELSPLHIANFFLTVAKEDKVSLTTMQLIKLVYIGYGWCLTIYGKKLFDEPIEAWKFGPVIPSLYHEFKSFGSQPINRLSIDVKYDQNTDNVDDIIVPIVEDENLIKVLNVVWKTYKNHSAMSLSNITHTKDSPWNRAYQKGQNTPLDDKDIIERCKLKIDQIIKGRER